MRELENKKQEIEIMLAEYDRAVAEAQKWYADWKRRNASFRCLRLYRPEHQQAQPNKID